MGSTTVSGNTIYGYRPSVPGSQQGFGSLSPNTFTRGTATVNVIRLAYNSGASGTLDFQISLASGTIPPDGLLGAVGLVLALGSETFAFTPGTTSTQFDFDRGGLSWNNGDTVAVSLAIAAPEPPTALQAAPYGDTAVLLSWTTPATGTPGGYKVEVSEDAGITWADAEDDTGSTDTSWIHEGLPAAATRHYRVSALVSGEASDPSATASATTCAAGVPWCPTLTAGTTIFGGSTFTGFSSTFPSIGSISPASFRHGGSTYTSDQFVHTDLTGSPTLILGFDSGPLAGFSLRSGAQVLALASATYSGTNFNYTWSTPPFGPWSNGQVVAFEFAATFPPPNTAPVITTTSPISVPENTTAVTTLAATDADTGTTLTWSKNGGADADAFTLTTGGVLTFTTAPDYENPTDTGSNNSYVVIVQVSDATATADLTLTVTVTDVAEQPEPVQAQTELPAGWSLIPSGARAGDDFRLLIVTSTRQTAANTDIADYNAVVQNDVSNTGHADIQGYAANFRMLGCTETVSAITNANTGSTDPAASIYWLNGAKVADDYAGLYDGSWDSNAPKFPDGENAPTSGLISQTLVGCTPAGMIDGTNHLAAALVTQGYPGFSGSEFGVFPVLVKENRRFYGLSEIFRVPAHTPATGAPAITGTARVGQTLTASTSGITDADGLTNVSYVYRWIRLDSDGMMNPTDIGTDASTYTLVAADVGKKIQVGVSFQDDSDNDEELTSEAYPSGTETIAAADTTNNAPTFTDGPSTSRSIAENTASGQNIGAPITATDADTGDTLTYDLGGTDAAAFGIVSASGQIQTRAALDYETKSSYTVTVTVSDGNGGSDSIDVTINVTPDGGGGPPGGGGVGPRTSVPGAPTNLTAVGGDGQAVLSWDAPASDGGAAITDYEYRINRSGPWIPIGSTDTTHTVTGLVNGTVYVFEVRAVNAAGGSASSNRGEAKPEVFTLDFAHFANGDGITSDLVFVNVGTHPIRPVISFYDQEGQPMAAESMVEITGDLEIQEDGSLSILTAMEPLGELTISTHGQGELVSGSVKVVAFGSIGGVLRFDLPGIGVAGVGASPPVRDAVFPVRRQEAGINTGVAIHNLESSAEIVRCELMREGVLRDAVSIPLAANGQSSWFIDAAFPAADTSGLAGSVHCDAAGPGMFTAVALELDAVNRIFTTLPVLSTRRAGGRAAELNFAHFANGAGLTSDLVFVNLSTERSRPAPTPFHTDILPVRPALYFYGTDGQPMAAESVVDITGDLAVTEDGGLTVLTEMEPLGVLTVSTHGRGELVSGSVRVVADEPIGGMLRFDLPGIGVAGVGVSSPVSDALFPVRRQEAGINTGVAVHNLGEEAMEVTCELMQGGTVLDDVSIPLAANGQSSWFIDQVFTGADTSDFAGSVRCTAPGEGMFTGVAVELDAANRIFTTLPVFPVPERMSQE